MRALAFLPMLSLFAGAGCSSTSADPSCSHYVALTSDGASVLVSRRCNTEVVVPANNGIYRADVGGPATLIAQESSEWRPAQITTRGSTLAVVVSSAAGDFVETRRLDGTLIDRSEPLSVPLLEPAIGAGGVWAGYREGLVRFGDKLVTDDRSLVYIRTDVRALHIVGDRIAVVCWLGQRTFVFDATDPSDLENAADITRGAVEVELTPAGDGVAIINVVDQQVTLYDLALTPIRSMSTGAQPRQLSISADGRFLATVEGGDTLVGSDDMGVVRVFELGTGNEVMTAKVPGQPISVALSDDGQRVFVGVMLQGPAELDIAGQNGVFTVDVAGVAVQPLVLPGS